MSNLTVTESGNWVQVTFKELSIEFYQRLDEDEWSVTWEDMGSRYDRSALNKCLTMMLVAGFYPDRVEDGDVIWVRPDGRPLWPER